MKRFSSPEGFSDPPLDDPKYLERQLTRFREGGDQTMEAQTLVDLADAHDDSADLPGVIVALRRRLQAAGIFDEVGKELEAWEQRYISLSRVLVSGSYEATAGFEKEFNRQEIQEIKEAMLKFENTMLGMTGHISKVPKYLHAQRRVQKGNRALGIGESPIVDDESQIGV